MSARRNFVCRIFVFFLYFVGLVAAADNCLQLMRFFIEIENNIVVFRFLSGFCLADFCLSACFVSA